MTHVLLNVNHDDQEAFENQFGIINKSARKNWWKTGHNNVAALLNGPPQRRDAIIGLAYRGRKVDRAKRNQWMENGAGDAMIDAPSDRAIVIGIDIDRKDYPYSVLACLEKRNAD